MAVEHFQTEEDFAKLLAEDERSQSSGALCEGVIVAIKDNEVLIDVRKKSEGVMDINEIQDANGDLTYKIGDKISVLITGSRSGRPLVSHKKALRKVKVRQFIENYDENADNIYEVKIISKNKGGYVGVNDDSVEFFIPRSQIRDTNIGAKIKVKVLKVNKDEGTIIASNRRIVDTARKERAIALENITKQEGIIDGVIKKITSYGMFVDVGGVDGLVHYKEISYKGPINPASLYKEGESVGVKILNYDKDKKHLSLSIKAAMPDPWTDVKDNLSVGDTIRVSVSNIEPYGAFVDLGNDIEGFLHISEISWDKNIKNPHDFIKEGDEIDVEVIEIDMDAHKLRVSLKNLLDKPFDEFRKAYKVGDVVKGKVVSTTAFGAFIRIAVNNGSVEGLLHNEDLSWGRNAKCKENLKIGDEIQVKIVKIDTEKQKISLSARELKDSPISQYAKTHKIGDVVKCTIKDIKEFGAFVSLEGDIEALLRKEDVNDFSALKIGDSLEAAIAFIDERKGHIRLSVKRVDIQKERDTLNKINAQDSDRISLGDIIKEQLA